MNIDNFETKYNDFDNMDIIYLFFLLFEIILSLKMNIPIQYERKVFLAIY